MFKLPKIELVTDLKTASKMWSMRLNAVASAIVAYIIADPSFLFSVVGFMPEERRVVLALGIGIAIFLLVAITRLTKQEKLSGTGTEETPPEQSERQ